MKKVRYSHFNAYLPISLHVSHDIFRAFEEIVHTFYTEEVFCLTSFSFHYSFDFTKEKVYIIYTLKKFFYFINFFRLFSKEIFMLFWILLLVLVSIAYALLIIWVLPKLILKSKYPIDHPTDRGLKKYKFSDSDYAIVYEPSLAARKYITQYILAKKDGKKTFKCKIAESVTYIDFDVALFNAQDKCFLVVNCMDVVERNGVTKETDLPNETAYASVIINQVNGNRLRQTQAAQVGAGRLCTFGLLSLILSIGMSVCTMLAFSNIFGGLFKETFAQRMLSSGWVFLFPTAVCAVCISVACGMLFTRNSKR